jgi:hypothetical protein
MFQEIISKARELLNEPFGGKWVNNDGSGPIGPSVLLYGTRPKVCGCHSKTLGRTLRPDCTNNQITKNASTLKSIGF